MKLRAGAGLAIAAMLATTSASAPRRDISDIIGRDPFDQTPTNGPRKRKRQPYVAPKVPNKPSGRRKGNGLVMKGRP